MSKIRFWTGDEVTKLSSNQIFVYDSNPQGFLTAAHFLDQI